MLKKQTKNGKFYDRLLNVILVVLVISLILEGSFIIYKNCGRSLSYMSCSATFDYQFVSGKTYDVVIEDLNSITNTNYKIEWVDSSSYCGATTILPFNQTVKIKKQMSVMLFSWVYTHEIMHQKLVCSDDRFVEFETFKLLYHSGDYYRNVALWRANTMNADSYDCKWYINNYLKNLKV